MIKRPPDEDDVLLAHIEHVFTYGIFPNFASNIKQI